MANETTNFPNEVDESKDFWDVKVRVIRKWSQRWRIDLIVIDENGNKMQVLLKGKLMPTLDPILQKDAILLFKKLGVGAQDDKFPVVDLPRKLIFYKVTEVLPSFGWRGHPYGFQFKNLEEISPQLMQQVLTVDVIGSISWCGNMDIYRSNTGKETKRLNLDLQNLNATVVKCTLWGDYVVQASNYVANHARNMEHVIMILQHCKIKIWTDFITIQNDMFGTRIFLDDDNDDINQFRRRNGGNGNSKSLLTTQTNYPMRNEFIVNGNRKSVEEVREIELVPGINYDPKKVKTKVEYMKDVENITPELENAPLESLWCPKCLKQALSVIPKFRVQFRVQEPTGSISFLMFDLDVCRLLGLSATNIRDRQLKSVDENSFPHEFDSLLERQLAFKIVVTDYNIRQKYYVYTVNKFCEDPEIIAEMLGEEDDITPEPENVEPNCVKLSESSQGGVDSKDVASVTGECLVVDVEKDSATSPVAKRPIKAVIDSIVAEEPSSNKRLRKKLEPYDV
uniref:replication protein A 70 kDa DNA-binding subunit A-like n=1 Tax=Erigeron canadensis TaxID=72917 RepID=UPI001CB8C39D|nr:replication protein A 70 kDa DNA-binding subunit A-like [Erigeron canadensis]